MEWMSKDGKLFRTPTSEQWRTELKDYSVEYGELYKRFSLSPENREYRDFLFYPGSIHGMYRSDDTPVKISMRKGIDGVLFHTGIDQVFAIKGWARPILHMGEAEWDALEDLVAYGRVDPRYIEEELPEINSDGLEEYFNNVGPGSWTAHDSEGNIVMSESAANILPRKMVFKVLREYTSVSNPSGYLQWLEWYKAIRGENDER